MYVPLYRSDISTSSRRGVGTVDVGALALAGAASPTGAGSPKPGKPEHEPWDKLLEYSLSTAYVQNETLRN